VAIPEAIIDIRMTFIVWADVPPVASMIKTTYSQPTDIRKICWTATPSPTSNDGDSSTSNRRFVGLFRFRGLPEVDCTGPPGPNRR
jgi:hypothetical protein